MYGVAELAFGDRRISLVAALLLALYPVSAFYDTDLVITSQAIILLTIALFGAFWTYHVPGQWIGAALLGVVIGAGAITRLEIAIAGAAIASWLFILRLRNKQSLLPAILMAAVALAFIVPVALHNQHGGADYLITPVGSTEIYRGFNRDASGHYAITRADITTGFDYFHFLSLDIRLEPMRFFALIIRKVGMFFSASEGGNNLNFAEAGEQVSLALRLNPLDFRGLLALTAFGTVAAWRSRHRSVLIALLMGGGAMFVMTMLIWIESRIRTPIIVTMIPLAAYGVIDIATHARQTAFWRARLVLVTLLLVIFSLSWIAENTLPHKVIAASLPPAAQSVNALYNGELRLLGYQIQEQYTPRSHFEPFRPYVVSFYWTLERPTHVDYSFALKFFVKDNLVDQFDHPIGYVSYPTMGTGDWQAGQIYVEHVGMSVRTFDVQQEISGYLWLDVYPERRADQVLTPEGFVSPTLELARPAVAWENGRLPTLTSADSLAPDSFTFGDMLTLEAVAMPVSLSARETLTITLGWHTGTTPIRESYVIGIFLQDEDGDFVMNVDSPPRGGSLLTVSLPTNY
jgi:hypothetical protein